MKKKFLLFIIIIFILIFVFAKIHKKDIYFLLDLAEENYVYVDKYYIYGTYLNIEGSIEIDDNINNAYIVFKNNKEELVYDLKYSFEGNKISFNTSEYINKGIYLDDIKLGDYLVFLKTSSNDDDKYYSLKNETNYNDMEYYTITRNNKNNLINFNFSNKKDKDYLCLSVKEHNDNNYYDIVIDAGHGGEDPGASYRNYNEAEITLDYALSLKEKLEELGLKIKLTRDDDTYINTYGKNSRTAIPHEVKAKYVFSVHLNSCEDFTNGGVEIYAPNGADLGLARGLAKNIKNEAKTRYSINEANKVEDGVYVRTFTKEEITESVAEAKQNGYNPYALTTDTNYYFIIRETGGFITDAYVDGRNKDYHKNDYYNSNIGVEGYLLEIGYINHQGDLNNLLNNKIGYINGIAKAIKEELNL